MTGDALHQTRSERNMIEATGAILEERASGASSSDAAAGPVRRCIVTREVLPKAMLIRFVIGPDGDIVPDVDERLPGRGLWVKAERSVLATAVAKNHFAKAAHVQVRASADLVDRTATLLARRCLSFIGLARRAGQAVCGFEKVREALSDGRIRVLLAAADGGPHGRIKLQALASGRPAIALFSGAELSSAFGRENVVHAALTSGDLAERFIANTARLAAIDGRQMS
jgi:predicted RNA-binding protein YlxR (DUF448 family)